MRITDTPATDMAGSIRRALYQKLLELSELRDFQRDFELISGLRLAFVDDLGMGENCEPRDSELCAAVGQSANGRAMCARSRHRLFAAAIERPSCAVCDAGLAEVVIPLRISGIPAGFFVFGGVALQAYDLPSRHRVRHLLRKAGVEMDDTELDPLIDSSCVMPRELLDAYQRIAHLAARQIALKVTDQLADLETHIPPLVVKACGFIRAKATLEEVSLKEIAVQCGVSEGHLSRLFHHATGLTFREYVSQIRAEHARSLLLFGSKEITEIASESGFQSLSQFHRVFRKTFGMTPSAMRHKRPITTSSH